MRPFDVILVSKGGFWWQRHIVPCPGCCRGFFFVFPMPPVDFKKDAAKLVIGVACFFHALERAYYPEVAAVIATELLPDRYMHSSLLARDRDPVIVRNLR